MLANMYIFFHTIFHTRFSLMLSSNVESNCGNATCFTCPHPARPSATKNRPTSTRQSTRIDPHSPNLNADGPSGPKFLRTVWIRARPPHGIGWLGWECSGWWIFERTREANTRGKDVLPLPFSQDVPFMNCWLSHFAPYEIEALSFGEFGRLQLPKSRNAKPDNHKRHIHK